MEEPMSVKLPKGLIVGECARCEKPVLIPIEDPKNHEMECCPRCTYEICRSIENDVKNEALYEFRATVSDLRRVPGGSQGLSVKGAVGSERREAVERFVSWVLSDDFDTALIEVVDEIKRGA